MITYGIWSHWNKQCNEGLTHCTNEPKCLYDPKHFEANRDVFICQSWFSWSILLKQHISIYGTVYFDRWDCTSHNFMRLLLFIHALISMLVIQFQFVITDTPGGHDNTFVNLVNLIIQHNIEQCGFLCPRRLEIKYRYMNWHTHRNVADTKDRGRLIGVLLVHNYMTTVCNTSLTQCTCTFPDHYVNRDMWIPSLNIGYIGP